MEQVAGLRQEMSVRMIPEQIVASTLLRMTALELRAHVDGELESNPALEMEERGLGELLSTLPVVTFADERPRSRAAAAADDEDYLLLVPARQTLADYLWGQFTAASRPGDHHIGRYLIECIDENGYLGVPLLEIATELDESPERIEEVLFVVQSLDPPGIGARDLRECLTLQLHGGDFAGEPDAAVALGILERGWDLLVSQDFGAIAHHLGRPEAEVQRGYAFIRRRLVPYPGQSASHAFDAPATAPALVPDVCVHRSQRGYEVEVTDAGVKASSLCINREYQNICRAMQQTGGGYSDAERAHVRQAMEQARMLIKGLARRARTLQQIAEYVVGRQRRFIEGDVQGLEPLTRREVSQRMGISESTVCRATIDKCVQLPSGTVIPFEAFFDVAAALKWRIQAMLRAEDPVRPLKDEEIASRLQADGIDIARRTVSKYREELGFPGYAERRRRARGQ